MTAEAQGVLFVVILQERFTHHVGISRHGETSSNFPEDNDKNLSNQLWGQIQSAAEREGGKIGSERSSHRPASQPRHFDGGIDTIHYLQNIVEFASAAGLGAFLKSAADIFFKWRKLHDGRTIKIKIGTDEITVNNASDLEKAVRTYQQLSGR